MKHTLYIAIILALLSSFSSCSLYLFYPDTNANIYAPTVPEDIKIYTGIPVQEYIVIGAVSTDVMGSADNAVNFLKRRSSEIGADAIIQVELEKINSFSARTGISGVAVKFKE